MQYFLAYEKNNGELVKINEPISTDFYDILSFTLSFDDNASILKYFKEQYLITNNVTQLYYCSQTNKKDKSSIKKLYRPYLFFKNSKCYFDPIMIREYLFGFYRDQQFLDGLFAHFMQKYGLITVLKEYLEKELKNEYTYALICRLDRIKTNVSDDLKNYINDFTSHFSSFSDLDIDAIINYIIETIVEDKKEYINFYALIRDNLIKKKRVKEFPIISQLYKIRSLYRYELSFNGYVEKVDYTEELDNLFKLMIFKYDVLKDINGLPIIKNGKKKKGFIVENGSYVIKSRDLYDIGCFISNYENMKKIKIAEEDFIETHREEKEEFLTEDDYRLMKKRDNDEDSY